MSTRPTYEDIERLVHEMRAGSVPARRALIEAHVGLAFKAAMPFEDDQALSDALMSLVTGVDAFKTAGRHPSALPSFLKTTCRQAAFAHRRNDPKKRMFRHDAFNDSQRAIAAGKVGKERDEPAFEQFDLLESIMATCESDEEREMVRLFAQAYNTGEVARMLVTSPTRVSVLMKQLRLRWSVQQKLRGECAYA